MSTETNSVIVELYDLSVTEKKDDRFGRVVTKKSLTEDDLINIAVQRRTDLNPSTLKMSLNLMKDVAKEEIANGASVAFGLGYFGLSVNGVFLGDNAKWDSSKNTLSVRTTPTSELRSLINNVSVDVRGMAEIGIVINTVTDVSSGEVNTRLTPGGGVNLAGSKIRIVGDKPEIGLQLINQITSEVTSIPMNSILTNEPSKVSFIVPATLAKGDYKLALSTQFSNQTTVLKEVRTYLYDYILTVM